MKKHIIVVAILLIIGIIARVVGADFTEFFCIGFLILIYGIIIARDIIKNTKSKVLRFLARAYKVCFAIFVATFIIIEGVIWYDIIDSNISKDTQTVPYIVVLGGGLVGDKPGNVLKGRLNKGIEYLNTHKNTKVICSGGQGAGEEVPESIAMKNYLIRKGIGKDRILLEEKSKSTIENLVYSSEILKKLNAQNDKIIIVTSSFNILRVRMIANDLNINAGYLGSTSKFRFNINYSIREFGGILDNFFELKTGIYI